MVKRGSVAVVAAGLVLTLGACGGGAGGDDTSSGRPAPTPSRTPSKELVTWVGGMCASTAELGNLRTESAADLKEIRNADRSADNAGLPAEALAVSYVSGTPSEVEGVQSDLGGLGSSGVPVADRLLDAWQTKLRRVVPQLDAMSPSAAFDDAEGSAADVDKLVQSLTPPSPDLPALTKKNPLLAAAYERAEQCAPGWKPTDEAEGTPEPDATGPLPKAADGKNTKACSDGVCEILVTSTADITANDMSVHITVTDDLVNFQTEGSWMQLGGAGGEATFGSALKAVVVAHNEEGAVLRFSAP
ncbi:hypothetical protein [Streptomyces fulvoviolaceus]|uniref:hypothetical protein n=1 Tax=Streptomyces fulvoviolaceus TaxID=285535 RepID=UPI0021BE7432|nr:hypothetical protein [Streptomyces fulvoviolaceus]MCT9075150.1 hypothetical protein [Streptomyces fulvoviolaceus]